jgi:hypothetical protein
MKFAHISLTLLLLLSAVLVSNAPAAERQNLHAVVAGVRTFQDPRIPPLKLSDKDAVDFAEFLKERADLLGKVHVTFDAHRN